MSEYKLPSTNDVLNRAAKACELNGWNDTAEQVRALAALRQEAEPVPNRRIDELLAEFEAEGCDHSNLAWVRAAANRYVSTMPDSQIRCLLHVLAQEQAGQAEPVAWTWPIGRQGKAEPRYNWALAHRKPPDGFGGEVAEPLYTAPQRVTLTRERLSKAFGSQLPEHKGIDWSDEMLTALRSIGLNDGEQFEVVP